MKKIVDVKGRKIHVTKITHTGVVRHLIGLVIYLIYLLIDCRYLVTEGQIFVVYFITFIAMLGYMIYKKTKQNSRLDANGLFLLYSFALCFVLVIIWVMYLWNDEALRLKYPGLLYIPEPWSYYTLYIRK